MSESLAAERSSTPAFSGGRPDAALTNVTASGSQLPPSGTIPPSSLPSATTSAHTSIPPDTTLPSFDIPYLRRRTSQVKFDPEEEVASARVAARIASCLTSDHIAALFPDVDTPFQSIEDSVNRLLPYHIFQYPQEDLGNGKGKGKAREIDILKEELAEARLACDYAKRRKTLNDRFRQARIKSGTRPSPDDQAYYLAQAVLETDRAETTSITSALRSSRSELEKIEREKRLAAMPSRPSFSATPSAAAYPQHYRPYHYPYAPYSATPSIPPAPSSSTPGYNFSTPVSQAPFIAQYFPHPSATSPPTPSHAPPASLAARGTPAQPVQPASTSLPPPPGAIPVQLPVSSLSALHALGIVPVPANTVSPGDQQHPAAVLLGSSANGAVLSLEINLSRLQSAQLSGLASMLNSIMRGAGVESDVPPPASYTQMGAPYSYPAPVSGQPPQAAAGHSADGSTTTNHGPKDDSGG